MIKKILFVIILVTLVVSCGKKAEPEYKETTYKYINQKNII